MSGLFVFMSLTSSESSLLTASQWADIQALLQINPIDLPWTQLNQAWLQDVRFADSTHSLVRLDTNCGFFYLKWPRVAIKQQPFWQGIQAWFGYRLAESYPFQFDWVKRLEPYTPFKLAEIVRSVSVSDLHQQAYVLTREMHGNSQPPKQFSAPALALIAKHFAGLQSLSSPNWGQSFLKSHQAQVWSTHTFKFIENLDLPQDLVKAAVAQAAAYPPVEFVPVMLDFRWDQLQWLADLPFGMVDMDAWVMAPASLNLAMLELLFDAKQAAHWQSLFVQELQQQGRSAEMLFTELSAWRKVFRLILFKLNWLGADNLQAWLSAPCYFDKA
ncbi:hypothetical protein JX580_01985 [Thiomicrospira microaerophila]|uniref:hypothetical protein n=1 Tax=Thiomicrospira microaerophila TaxID=406020 RepID=UPI00200C59A1|nr:hypothetical protein [Thiomicrospira microaerophila]UQB42688.1 hypothetical protein JX580_01985 [Thiomicrospira microaerophila]